MRHVDPRTSRRAELLERFELDPTKKGRAYSKGNRQKVALVAAFAADSDLLVLDEPTSGLDPLMEQVFNECVAEHTARGATVLLSSHILSEVERLADRVTIIREGRTVESGTLEALGHLRQSKVSATFAGAVPELDGMPGVHGVAVEGRQLTCTVDREGAAGPAHRAHRGRHRGTDQHAAEPGGALPRRLPLAGRGRPVNGLAGTGLLTRHFARRDRVIATVWVLVIVVLAYVSAAATPGLYATEADRIRAATEINKSGAIVALYGPIVDVTSEGELAMTKMTVLYAVFAAILFVVLVRRHTRVEEENGQTELVGGTAVGRDAPLAAAVAESVLVGAGARGCWSRSATSPAGCRSPGRWPSARRGSAPAVVAAGIAAVCAQLSASARTCAAYAAGTIGVLFLLRAVGDTTSAGWLSWLSPLGWNTQLRAYGDTRWWLLLAYVALAGALVGVAAALRGRRDLGSGLVAARPGPAEGSPRLRDVFSLAVVVHGWQLALWSLSVAVTGVLFGFIAPGIDDLLDSASAQEAVDALGGEMIAAVMFVVAVVITCFGIVVIGHAGADEGSGRAEAVMATATSRAQWFGAVMLVALGGTAWLLVVSGAGLWVGYLGADAPTPGDVFVAALAWIPAAWVVVGLAALTFSWRSRWTVLAWVWPAFFLVVTLLGDLLTWPDWALDVSPYSWVPHVPAEPWSWSSFLGLAAVALALCGAAWVRFRQRDIG